jgi:7-cyano-7-deazaguanine synthase
MPTWHNSESALVLLSGGQDSSTCLAWALNTFGHVETVGFDYRQRHGVELECRETVLRGLRARFPSWTVRLGEDHKVDVRSFGTIAESALTRDSEIQLSAEGLPTSFVPGRNVLFLAMAGALAYRRGFRHIVGGMCEMDYAGYPDCRDDTIKAMQLAINLGMQRRFLIHTPLMWIDKAETWTLALSLGGEALVEFLIEETHTCFLGDRSQRHAWGYGCGTCPACLLRSEGYLRFRGARAPAAD